MTGKIKLTLEVSSKNGTGQYLLCIDRPAKNRILEISGEDQLIDVLLDTFEAKTSKGGHITFPKMHKRAIITLLEFIYFNHKRNSELIEKIEKNFPEVMEK